MIHTLVNYRYECLHRKPFSSGYRSINQAAPANCLRNVGTSGVGSGRESSAGVPGWWGGGGVGVLGLGCSIGVMTSEGYKDKCRER